MQTDVVAKDMIVEFEDVKGSFLTAIGGLKDLFQAFVKTYAQVILDCENEKEFLQLLASLGDELYHGNIVTEAIDYPVFLFILEKIDTLALDKFFGNEWFIKLQAMAKSVIDAKLLNEI
jgi:hypothetical protein